jgi:hypothetical protein
MAAELLAVNACVLLSGAAESQWQIPRRIDSKLVKTAQNLVLLGRAKTPQKYSSQEPRFDGDIASGIRDLICVVTTTGQPGPFRFR